VCALLSSRGPLVARCQRDASHFGDAPQELRERAVGASVQSIRVTSCSFFSVYLTVHPPPAPLTSFRPSTFHVTPSFGMTRETTGTLSNSKDSTKPKWTGISTTFYNISCHASPVREAPAWRLAPSPLTVDVGGARAVARELSAAEVQVRRRAHTPYFVHRGVPTLWVWEASGSQQPFTTPTDQAEW
jgi:hypothetical protein